MTTRAGQGKEIPAQLRILQAVQIDMAIEQAADWTLSEAAHLLNRAGFGGAPTEIAALHGMGREGAVNALLKGDDDDDLFPPPAFTPPAETFRMVQEGRMGKETNDAARALLLKEAQRQQRREALDTRAWWLGRMRYTVCPLREKMTLFLHSHFASSIEKVKSAYSMWQQNETLRSNALGNFVALARKITRDPAMIRYLDLAQSKSGQPNENFARELMELFTLGEGVKYTEDDIRESARAFTGYRVDPRTMSFRFVRRQFDSSEKVFMGERGPFSGDDIIEIITNQPECSRFLARKLWIFFAGTAPSESTLDRLAARMRFSKYELKPTLKELFLSPEFYGPTVIRHQVKSPVQWIVQTCRILEVPLPADPVVEYALRQMGQVPLEPPNVKGWEGGRAWISSATLLFRYNFAGALVHGTRGYSNRDATGAAPLAIPWDRVAPAELRKDPSTLLDALAWRLYNAPLTAANREKFLSALKDRGTTPASVRDTVQIMMCTPEFQIC